MNLVFLQRLDREGGGSRASLKSTLQAILRHRPEWKIAVVTQERGPVSEFAEASGIARWTAEFPRFRKPWERLRLGKRCRELAECLREFQPTHVVSNEWVTAPHARRLAALLQAMPLSYVRDFAAIGRGRKYELHRMDRLLCVCESMRQGLLQAGYDSEKTRTVYNPVLRPPLREPDEAICGKITASPVDRWLLYLGRISPRKNQIDAVETLRSLREMTGQRWGLLLAGDADPDYAAMVDRCVSDSGMDPVVLRLGVISDPGWLIDLADASLMTSKSEGLARVLIESFLCGTPAFSYPLEGLEDIYGEGIPFFVAAERTPDALAAKIGEGLAAGGSLQELAQRIQNRLEIRHAEAGHFAAFEAAVRDHSPSVTAR